MLHTSSPLKKQPFLFILGLAALISCEAPESTPLLDQSSVDAGTDTVHASVVDGAVPQIQPSTDRTASPEPTLQARTTALATDPALRASFVRARQLEAGEQHHIQRLTRTFQARNEAHRFAMRFEDHAVAISNIEDEPATEGWSAALRFSSIGRAGQRREPVVSSAHADGARMVYRREGMEEWYVNGPLGLEQGFTLAAPEPGTGDLEIAVAIDGDLRPQWNDERLVVELIDGRDRAVLQVSDLFATDATGQLLPTTLTVQNGNVVLRVDDALAKYPIEIDPLVTTAQTIVQASDHEDESFFGFAVAVDGNRAVVGAPDQDSGVGAAYVFVRSGSGATTTWAQESKLRPPGDSDPTRKFGTSVAISGSRIAVGAPRTRDGRRGRAFVFVRSGSDWNLEDEVDGEHPLDFDDVDDFFGAAVALDANTLCVGAPEGEEAEEPDPDAPIVFLINHGVVLCFTRSGSNWSRRSVLWSGAGFDFGTSLALMRNTLLVGDVSDTSSGGVVWFERTNESSSFERKATLRPPTNVGDARFGATVALSDVTSSENGVAIVGEPGAFTIFGNRSGRASVFKRNSSGWTREATLIPTDGRENSVNGLVGIATNTALNQTTAVVGGDFSATLFARSSSGTWTEQSKVTTLFTRAVDMDPSTLVLGIPQVFFGTNEARLYRLGLANGNSCSSTAQCASGFCVDGRCCNSACGDGANDCQACSTNAGGTTNGTCTSLTSAVAPTVTCRASGGSCDIAEKCSSSSKACPTNALRPSTFECRTAAGPCDNSERCTGSSVSCPSNAFKSSSTSCRTASGPCDNAEMCSGSSASCPADALKASGASCRSSAGVCDVAELCNGASASCPANAVRPNTFVCRPTRPDEPFPLCDPAEYCDGAAVSCPADFQLCPF